MPEAEKKLILKLIGATIMGVKPAELVNVKIGASFTKIKEELVKYPEIHFMEIKRLKSEPRIQVLFYHASLLQAVFQKKCNQSFLKDMGYYPENSLGVNLEILRSRFMQDKFPDEIGLFVGYPLKDVLGFMGICPLECVGARGWRYYGSLELSQNYYNTYKNARDIFEKQLYS